VAGTKRWRDCSTRPGDLEIFAPQVIKVLPGNATDDEVKAAKEGFAAYQREMDALLTGRRTPKRCARDGGDRGVPQIE
jgi:hypothetical protein